MDAPGIAVKYIFRRPRWVDRIYGTELEFVTGQTRLLPHDLALKFLRHTDTFEIDAGFVDTAPAKSPQQQTDEALEDAEAARKAQQEREQEIFMLHDQIDQMDKDALAQYAHDKFNVPLNKRHSIADLRVEAKALVDRFGVT